MNSIRKIATTLILLISPLSLIAGSYVEPTLNQGAKIFNQRCTICHGNVGMGDGLLPSLINNYPNTNLLLGSIGHDPQGIREAIIYGGERSILNEFMPPFGDELTWLEIESLVMFMQLYYEDTTKALNFLSSNRIAEIANHNKGRAIYKQRCILCHGINGDGKGKMAEIIKNPPPFDFRISRAPDAYIQKIVSKGGEAMGRSPKMPIFGDELNKSDIGHLIAYIKIFRQ